MAPHLSGLLLSSNQLFSTSQLVVFLVAGIIFGALGYWLSEVDRRKFGRTPWGLPSGVWALFWFLSLLLGLILYLIAHADVVRRARQFPGGRFPETGAYGASTGSVGPTTTAAAPRPPPSAAELFPAYPRPANAGVELGRAAGGAPEALAGSPVAGTSPIEPGPGGGAPDPDDPSVPADASRDAGTTGASPPAWHPDPSGRFHYRWWDGSQWTSYVSYNGQQLVDTSPDQRIGPY